MVEVVNGAALGGQPRGGEHHALVSAHETDPFAVRVVAFWLPVAMTICYFAINPSLNAGKSPRC